MSFCTKCGNKSKDGTRFCGSCGSKLDDSSEETTSKKDTLKKYTNYECEFCGEGFNTELDILRHEKNCPSRKTKEDLQPAQQNEPDYTKRSSNSTIVVIIIVVVIAAIVLMVLYNQGAAERTAVGQIKSLFN